MAELFEIQAGGVVYDVKDAKALRKPLTEGTLGQIPANDGNGGTVWTDPQSGPGGSFNIHTLTQENNVDDNDEFVLYDLSALSHRKTLWSNIKALLKTYFDSIYATASALMGKQDLIDSSHKLSYNLLSGTPTIPDELADLTEDATHRTVTDTEKSTWNAKGTYSKPANGIPDTDLTSEVQASLDKADAAIPEPASEGTSGQVLTTDGNGGRSWTTPQGGGGSATWGGITGTLANQTDLKNALDAKGTYTKPATGIPASDLSQDAKTAGRLVVTLSTSGSTVTADKTTSEIYNAYLNRMDIELRAGEKVYGLKRVELSMYSFTYLYFELVDTTDGTIKGWRVYNDGAWSSYSIGLQGAINDSHKLSADYVDDTNTANKFVTSAEKATWNGKSDFSGSYEDLTNKPTIPDVSGKADKVSGTHTNEIAILDSGGNLTAGGKTLNDLQDKIDASHKLSYNLLSDTPTIPDELADLSEDATHRTVTDTEKSTWNEKGTYSKPANGIPDTDLTSEVQASLDKADAAIPEPASEGTSGQVLTTDGNGGRSWTTPQGGGGDTSTIEEVSATALTDINERVERLNRGSLRTATGYKKILTVEDYLSIYGVFATNLTTNLNKQGLAASQGKYLKDLSDVNEQILANALVELALGVTIWRNIAAEFSPSTAYNVGDYCFYSGILYRCTTSTSASPAFDNTKFAQTTVMAELIRLTTNA